MARPNSLGHAVLHLMDYLGDAAKVAEHLDHGEADQARLKAQALLTKRFRRQGDAEASHWTASADAMLHHLELAAGGITHIEPEVRHG